MLNPRLERFYEKIICEDFIVLYNFTNITLLPKLENAILSSTSKNFGSSKITVLQSFCGWRLATGQKSVVTRAHKSIALFNIRKDALLGLKATLRKKTLFSFFDKVLLFVLPKTITKINNYKEKQNNTLHLSQFSQLNAKCIEDALSNVYGKENNKTFNVDDTAPGTQNQLKPIASALPSFLKSRQVFFNAADKVVPLSTSSLVTQKSQCIKDAKQSNAVSLQLPRKKNIAFRNKLYKNWAKQKSKKFSMSSSLIRSNVSPSMLKLSPFSSDIVIDKKIGVNTSSKTKSFFTLSNSSAFSFPEISSLLTFFDTFSGFSLTFSLKTSKFLQNFTAEREYLIKKQLFSAFGCPSD